MRCKEHLTNGRLPAGDERLAFRRRKLRGKRNLVSVLDHIEGIGPKRRKLIWEHFGSLAKIREASVEELASLDGMTFPAAQAVYNFFAAQALLHNKAAEKGV